MCLSGDVTRLGMDQWNIIEKGIAFYKKISPVIKRGQSYWFGPEVASIRHPEGWQAILRVGEAGDNAYITIHIFDGTLPEIIEVSLPGDCPCHIEDVFSDSKVEVVIENRVLKYRPMENKKAVALFLISK
jgi:alpha-galactosidase